MGTPALIDLVKYANKTLKIQAFEDWPGAVNGLQVENGGTVRRIAAAVDGSLATIKLAIESKANLLIVHHGLFWGPSHPWIGKRYEMLRVLLENDVAVYSAHLPLDAHPVLGNNAILCRLLGFQNLAPFFQTKGNYIGWKTDMSIDRTVLNTQLGKVLAGKVTLLPGGPLRCRKIGVVTGGAGDDLKVAASEGVDSFITGEGRHWTYALAEDLGINVFYGGHYATETFGVQALAQLLSRRFNIPWTFIDHPTGL